MASDRLRQRSRTAVNGKTHDDGTAFSISPVSSFCNQP